MKPKRFKREKPYASNKKEDKTMWPFKNNRSQKVYSLVIGLAGLLFTSIGINDPSLRWDIGIQLSYTTVGFILFMVGIFYLIDATS